MRGTEVLWRDRDVTLAYPRRPVMSGLNGDYRRGERWVLIGANGSGKTTFLRAAIEPRLVTSGRREISCLPSKISYLPQSPRLAWGVPCSARDFLLSSFTMTIGRRAASEFERSRIDEMLDKVGLTGMAQEPVATLSGGQVQRLCFARALLLHAEILLLDEPFAAIDPESKNALLTLLDEIQPSTLQLLVLHDPLDVLTVGAPILRAADGSLETVSGDAYRRLHQRTLDVVSGR